MNISKNAKKILNSEFDITLKKMIESNSPDEIMYYFTAFYNVINRVYNIEFSEDLLFANFIMENAYNNIIQRMGLVKAGNSSVVGFHKNFGSAFIKIIEEIRNNFFNKEKRIEALQKLVLLAFTTTGNGFYLSQKNNFDLPLKDSEETKKLIGKQDTT